MPMADRKNKLVVQGGEISYLKEFGEEEYISLTDIARQFNSENPSFLIINWVRNKDTIEFLGVWEKMNNANFNLIEFDKIKNEAGSNRFVISVGKWISHTGAKGIISKPGRYGGTFAHRDIAFGFGYWMSPAFQLYLIKEFQRLKEDESYRLGEQWSVRREISKANHPIFTKSIQKNLIPPKVPKNQKGIFYANETDVLNLAVFGMTAKQWKIENPKKKGNIRDHATNIELLVLSNLQVLDASLIEWGSDQQQRIDILTAKAREQKLILSKSAAAKRLKGKK